MMAGTLDSGCSGSALHSTKWSVPLKTDYLKLEPASRFKNAIVNWLFEYWTRSFDPRIRPTGSVFVKSIHSYILEMTRRFETYQSQQRINFSETELVSRIPAWIELVSLAASFSLVAQHSSPQTAAHIGTTFLSSVVFAPMRSLTLFLMWPIRAQETVFSIVFPAFSNSAFDRSLSMAESPEKILQGDCYLICSTSVQKKKIIYLEKVLLIFRRLSVPVWM